MVESEDLAYCCCASKREYMAVMRQECASWVRVSVCDGRWSPVVLDVVVDEDGGDSDGDDGERVNSRKVEREG